MNSTMTKNKVPGRRASRVADANRDHASEERRLTQLIDEQRLHFEKASRNKDEFLAVLAHELRSPLSAISYAVSLMRLGAKDAGAEEVWDLIGRQTEQMSHLIEGLMNASKTAQGELNIRKVPVELGQLISQAIESARPKVHTHRQNLNVSLPAQPVNLLADPVRIIEIITNLLNNAAKYTDEGGQILLTAAEENNEVAIQVRDNGIGIASDMLPQIFEPFTQLNGAISRSEGGIGIGLAIVARLVRLHGGTVQVFSDGLGCGSRFEVRLPLLLSRDMDTVAAGCPEHSV